MFKYHPTVELCFVMGSAMAAQREHLREIYETIYTRPNPIQPVAEMTYDERIELEDRLGI